MTVDLSIIIPTYNRLPLLREALDSFVGKLACSYEVIVVDDGSTDGTIEYLRAQSEPICPTFNAHRGAQAARNTGMSYVRGRFVKFLDDDDLLEPDGVNAQVQFMQRNTDVDVVFSDWDIWYTDQVPPVTEHYIGSEGASFLDSMLAGWQSPPFNFLWRQSVIDDITWDEGLRGLQDTDFALRVALTFPKHAYLPGITGKYRKHSPHSVSLSTSGLIRVRASTPLNKWMAADDGGLFRRARYRATGGPSTNLKFAPMAAIFSQKCQSS